MSAGLGVSFDALEILVERQGSGPGKWLPRLIEERMLLNGLQRQVRWRQNLAQHFAVMPAMLDDRMRRSQCYPSSFGIAADPVMPGRYPAATEFKRVRRAGKVAGEAASADPIASFQNDRRKSVIGTDASCSGARQSRSQNGDVAVGLRHSRLRSPDSMLISAALPPDAVVSIEQTRSVAKRLR